MSRRAAAAVIGPGTRFTIRLRSTRTCQAGTQAVRTTGRMGARKRIT